MRKENNQVLQFILNLTLLLIYLKLTGQIGWNWVQVLCPILSLVCIGIIFKNLKE
jgi:uncharacterized membrane protein (DUF485 family)